MSRAKRLIEGMDDLMPHGTPAEEPESGRRTVSIGAILALLPPHVQEQVAAILTEPQDVFVAARKLKPLLAPYTEVLERGGYVADYLSYALPYHVYNQQAAPETPQASQDPGTPSARDLIRGFYDDPDTGGFSHN